MRDNPNRRQRRHPDDNRDIAVTTEDLIRRRKLWPVIEAAEQLGIHRATLYRLVEAGELAFTRVGGRTFVTDAELDRFVARAEVRSQQTQQAAK